MKMKRYSIQRYLKSFVLLWILIVSILTTIWVYYDAKHEVDELFDASLVQSARVLDSLLHLHPFDEELPEFTTLSGNLKNKLHYKIDQEGHEYEKKVAFQIWDKNGELLFKSQSAPEDRFAPSKKGFHRTKINDHGWRTFSLYSEQNLWWLFVAESDEIREELAAYIVRDHILPLILGIPLLLLVLHYLISKGLSPLTKIATLLGNKHYQDLTPIHDKKTPEEVLGLVHSLNNLFYKLQDSYARESRFSADAAHELRSPLAALMIHADNALEDVNVLQASDAYSKDSMIQNHLHQQEVDLGHLKRSIQRLTHNVEQLLALSRAETQTIEEDRVLFNLYDLCQTLAREHQNELDKKQQQLTISVAEDCQYLGYKILFTMMVSNLLSNAIKYTPEHSEIRLSASIDDEYLRFICEDSGAGIAKDDRERVKDRFYRMPCSKTYGAGLGLSIVDEIVQQHQGSWQLSRSSMEGLKVLVELPNR